MTTQTRATAAMICSAGCWGGATTLSKAVLEEVPALTLILVQLTASIAFLWLAAFVLGRVGRISWRAVKNSWLGVLEPGGAYLLALFGLQSTSASVASLIGATEPIMVLILAMLFFRVRPAARSLVLAAAAISGVLLTLGPELKALSLNQTSGAGLVAAGTAVAAFYVLLSKRSIASGEDTLVLAALQQSWGLALIILLASLSGNRIDPIALKNLGPAAISGVIQYAIAFSTYLFAIRAMRVDHAVMYLNLIPVFGLAAAAIGLGERLSPLQWGGAIIVSLALYFVNHANPSPCTPNLRG